MDSIDFTTVLKLFSVTVFWSFSSVCRLFHAVGAENVKASFSQFSSVFAWWLWEQQMTKCQENKDCNFHIWSLKDLLIQLLGYLTWLITLLNDVSFSYPYLEDVYNVNFGVFRLWFWFFSFCYRKSNVVVEARQVAMRIFEDYTQSWHWILLWVCPLFSSHSNRNVLCRTSQDKMLSILTGKTTPSYSLFTYELFFITTKLIQSANILKLSKHTQIPWPLNVLT